MVVAADLVRVGVDMHQPLARRGNVEQRIGLRRRLRHPPTHQQYKISGFDAHFQLGIDGEADFAGKIVMLPVERARAAKRAGDGKIEAFGKPGESGGRALGPSASAQNGDRPLR